jgi:hypothetical protein
VDDKRDSQGYGAQFISETNARAVIRYPSLPDESEGGDDG